MAKRAKVFLVASALAAMALALFWALSPAPSPEREEIAAAPEPEAKPMPSPPPQARAVPSAARATPPHEVDPMERLRALVDSDPAAALALAREDEQRSPQGRFADERSVLAMRALVHLGKIAAARDEATAFFQKYPQSPWAERVERLTGVHPRGYYQNFR